MVEGILEDRVSVNTNITARKSTVYPKNDVSCSHFVVSCCGLVLCDFTHADQGTSLGFGNENHTIDPAPVQHGECG